jgi:DNA-binding transcriptional regulator YiaG
VPTLNEVLRPVRARRGLPTPEDRRAIRKRAGLSAADVAKVLDVTRATVTRWEHALRTPRGDLAVRYSRLLERLRQESA